MMRAAIYARFSSDNQREQSIEDQVRVCKEYAKNYNITIQENHIYFDEAKSGAIRNRPGLDELKKAAEAKQFDALLVDDASRLSRDNQHFNTLLCLFQFWGIDLISVSDGLNTKEEHAKVAYQFRGIINELYLSDLKKKTHRGQMGQVLRGYTMGGLGYGYKSVPVGETKYDKKGRLRADGFKAVIVTEEARVIIDVFTAFINGKAVNKIVKDLNEQSISTKKRLKGGWNISTVTRILKNEKYTGQYIWNKHTSKKDPLSGKRIQVERPKDEWVIQYKPEMQIISDEIWEKTLKRWKEIKDVHPNKPGRKGFYKDQKSYVTTHPPHLLSGNLRCGNCKGSISLVSGKGSGYYGCLNASMKSCDNKMLISRKKLEKHLIEILYDKVLHPELLDLIYEKTAQKVKEQFSHIPKEIKMKKVELNQVETRVHNFIEFIANGRATASITDALEEAEKKTKLIREDLESLEQANTSMFTPPPKEWIKYRISQLQNLLEQKTEQSAMTLRQLTGIITLSPKKPEVGRQYYHAKCKIKSLALLDKKKCDFSNLPPIETKKPPIPKDWDGGSNSLQWWRRRELNPRPFDFNM